MTVTAPKPPRNASPSRLKESTSTSTTTPNTPPSWKTSWAAPSTPRHTCVSSTSTCTSTKHSEAVSEHYRAEPNPITDPSPTRPRPRRIHPRRHPRTRPGRRHRRAPTRNCRIRRAHPRHRQLPERYLAHHYLRYLGDLSGGQAVAALGHPPLRHPRRSTEHVPLHRTAPSPRSSGTATENCSTTH